MTPGGMAKMGNPDGLSQSGMHGKMRNPVATTKERDARVKSGVKKVYSRGQFFKQLGPILMLGA